MLDFHHGLLELVFVHPNDEDKYSYRDNEKKDSAKIP